ncbi:EpsG family protein [Pseudomonas guineae]|uniref:EpsG family protein n=1 Tax=Pseudomonas guineae TaxID=425504 RepID=A0A1I3CUD7_9PSED|nr:EpsG family protein [Pseudomonas guineae]SFH78154.1 EpsG family protein [Pseudomonas guineae]
MYMLAWWALFVSALYSLYSRSKTLYVILVGFFIYVAAVVAPETSRDAAVYIDYYNSVIAGVPVDVEFSFKLICYVAEYFFSSSAGIFYIYALISIPVKAFVIWRLSPYPLLSLFAYASYAYLLYDFTQIRAGLAASFVLLAFYFYVTNAGYKASLALAAAVFFHFSAFVFAFAFVLFGLGNFLLVSFILFSLTLLMALVSLLAPGELFGTVSLLSYLDFTGKVSIYLSLQSDGVLADISFVRRLAPVLYCLLPLIFHVFYIGRDRLLLLYMEVLCIGMFAFSFFSALPALAYRFSDYFFIFCCLSLAHIWRLWGRTITFIYTTAYCCGMMYYMLFYLDFAG